MPHRGGRGGGRGRGRAPRGDVRAAILLLLAEEPMHGYQLMQSIAERSGGRWTPSPGAVYPALNQLEDEGLLTVTAESGRKTSALTDAGREYVQTHRDSWSDPFAGFAEARQGPDLRALLEQLHAAARQIGRSGTDTQIAAAATILSDARRSMYLLLAEGPEAAHE
jgi:DNA-binding PadR family transcriptional regulator